MVFDNYRKYNFVLMSKELENQIITVIKTVYDPEIPVDVYELGLIYEIKIRDNNHVDVLMTLTSPNCPEAEALPQTVKDRVASLDFVTSAEVEITFDPPWDKDMMSEEAQLELGFL